MLLMEKFLWCYEKFLEVSLTIVYYFYYGCMFHSIEFFYLEDALVVSLLILSRHQTVFMFWLSHTWLNLCENNSGMKLDFYSSNADLKAWDVTLFCVQ